jgi:HK97 family phage prohead protease
MQTERLMCGLVEVKFAPDDAGAKVGLFTGYASVFNVVDAQGDNVAKGAFGNSLREWETRGKLPPMLLQHGGFFGGADDMLPIGKYTSMEENSKGLKVEGQLFALDTDRGAYIYEGLKAGVLDGLSIGYVAKKFKMGTKPNEARRTLEEVDLREVSIVTYPANDKSRINSVKSIETIATLSDAEDWLRDAAGLSHRQALAFVSRVKGLRPSDSEGLKELLALVKGRSFEPIINR